MAGTTTGMTQAKAARLAGAMYLFAMAAGIFGESFVRGALVVRGNAALTAQNILGSEQLFRIGIVADLLTYSAVVVLTWALYVLLKPVDRSLALLAVLFRLIEVAIHCVATVFSLVALMLLGGTGYLDSFGVAQLQALARLAIAAQGAGLNLGFVLLGLGSTVFAWLLLRSGYVPRALAGWGVFASLLLAASAVAFILFPAVAPFRLGAMVPMFVYEVGLGAWLLLKGARLGPGADRVA